MNKTEKMTNVKALTYVVENFKEMPTEVAEKIGNILATYEKKSASTGERKLTEKQIASANAGVAVAKWLGENKGTRYTAGDIYKHCPACAELESVQRLTPILTKMVSNDEILKEVIKGRTYYTAIV